jgi:hypothetical protein
MKERKPVPCNTRSHVFGGILADTNESFQLTSSPLLASGMLSIEPYTILINTLGFAYGVGFLAFSLQRSRASGGLDSIRVKAGTLDIS